MKREMDETKSALVETVRLQEKKDHAHTVSLVRLCVVVIVAAVVVPRPLHSDDRHRRI